MYASPWAIYNNNIHVYKGITVSSSISLINIIIIMHCCCHNNNNNNNNRELIKHFRNLKVLYNLKKKNKKITALFGKYCLL